jgi:membrane protein YdbS with pleckstrin-like domain
LRLENGEALVISVTPVPQGLTAPLVAFVLLEGAVIWLATLWSLLHRYEGIALVAVGVLPAFVIATRTWRWRSYKVTLTTQRLVIDGGVLARYSTQVNLGDVFATHADQSFAERLRRRGVVLLETSAGTVTLPAVRHPAALRRLVDRTRRDYASSASPSWDEWFTDPRSDPRGRGLEE